MLKNIITAAIEIVAIKFKVCLCSLSKDFLYSFSSLISVSAILFPETKNIEMKNAHNINQGDNFIFKRKMPEIVLIIKFVEIIIISKNAISLRKKLYNWEDTNNNKTKKENSGER